MPAVGAADNYHGALVAGEDGLVTFGVLGLHLFAYPFGQGGLAEAEERLFELLVGAVEEEAERTSARCGVVDHFGHEQVVVAEVELVADADLAGGVHQYVPQAQLAVELAQQEDLDLGPGLLLVAVQTCGEDLGIVEYEEVLFVEVLDDVLEDAVLDGALGPIDHHQTRFIAVLGRIPGQHVGRELVAVLR